MKTIKDKKKFGWNKKPKNYKCKKFGYFIPKEVRKERRKEKKLLQHKMLMHVIDDIK